MMPHFIFADTGLNPAMMQMVMIGGMLVVMYFFMIRPQMERAKKEKQFREQMKKGDSVVTLFGLHGRVAAIEEGTVLLEVDNNVKIRVDKAAIKGAATK